MALKKSITVSNNFQEQQTFDDSYAKVYKISGGNFIAQAYHHMKEMPEFANAKDC